MAKIRVKFKHIDPYTLDVLSEDKVIDIESVEAAVRWVKQSYYKVWTVNAKKVKKGVDKQQNS